MELVVWFGVHGLFIVVVMTIHLTTGFVYEAITERADAAHPDDLPLSAGRFAAQAVEQRQLPIQVVAVSDKGRNGFAAAQNLIFLTASTWVKHDPTAWAVAAHELGHALVCLRHRAVGLTFVAARTLERVCRGVVLAAMLCNLGFSSPLLSHLALGALLVCIVANLLVLVDESVSSAIAMRLLRGSGHVGPAGLRHARRVLLGALSTYVAGLVGQVVLLAFFAPLDELARARGFAPAAPLSGASAAAALVLSLLVVSYSCLVGWHHCRGWKLRRLTGRNPAGQLFLATLPRTLLTVPLLWLVWNQPIGPAPVLVVAAVVGTPTLTLLLMAPSLALGCGGVVVVAPLLYAISRGTRLPEPDHGPDFEARKAAAMNGTQARLRASPPAGASIYLAFEWVEGAIQICGPAALAVAVLVFGWSHYPLL